jgi:HlyD family secretion protein
MKNLKIIFALVLLMVATGCNRGKEKLDGYVEGEFVRVAPTTGGVLAQLSVERGDQVKAGQPLFTLDLTTLVADRDAAQAELKQARSTWADLTKGKRPEEVAVIAQQRAQAAATLDNAQKVWQRTEALSKSKAVSVRQHDLDKAAYDQAVAQVKEQDDQLTVAGLGGREDEVAAALAAIDAADQKLKQAEKRLMEASPKAMTTGQVEDTFYRPGEYVAAGSPVVSYLPPENVKVRFFVPEKHFAQFHMGEAVTIHCDGCSAPVPAKITFMANQAEFTPPVIYSIESRDKLVFLIEAKPDQFEPMLKPGLPVDVAPRAP